MPIPNGARSVEFQINGYNPTTEQEGPFFKMNVSLDSANLTELDAAATAAGDAALASLETALPSVTFSANRTYTCLQTGDSWPST